MRKQIQAFIKEIKDCIKRTRADHWRDGCDQADAIETLVKRGYTGGLQKHGVQRMVHSDALNSVGEPRDATVTVEHKKLLTLDSRPL